MQMQRTNNTDLADSGVSLSDNDIPPSSFKSSKFDSMKTNSKSSHSNKKVHKHDKYVYKHNDVSYNERNDAKSLTSSNRSYIVNYDDSGDHDDGNENKNSLNFDNKLKVLEGGSSRYQQKTRNCIHSKSEGNICQQRNFEKLVSTIPLKSTPIATTVEEHNNKSSLQYNELQEWSAITMPSLTIPSTTSDNLPPNSQLCGGSPAASIYSINSTIITSDSDLDSDAENYTIKSLGTQVTYTPNDSVVPNINRGHMILNQKIIAKSKQSIFPSLGSLTDVRGNIGAAQALGRMSSISVNAQRPQIGSIALNNSSDVTFGDKHFYEGPVTIQQFLIDNPEKSKEANGKENPKIPSENAESSTNNAKDTKLQAAKSSTVYDYILKYKIISIPAILALTTLLIATTVWGSKILTERKSKLAVGNNEESRNIIPINSTIAQDNVGGGYVFRMVPRDGWLAQPPVNPWVKLKLPVDRVIVIATRTSECETQASCTYTVRITQTYNIESQQQDDIIYNFLIGGDGNVYEGRGWDNRGSIIKGYNDDSINFAFIGSFKKQRPSYKQLNVTKLLLEEGARLKKLSSNYKIVGANKLDPTSDATSADALYKSFEDWPHWSHK